MDPNTAQNGQPDSQTSEQPQSNDPNEPAAKEDESDAFNLTASSLILIQEAYEKILTPELISPDGLVDYATLRRKRSDIMTAASELESLNPAVLWSLPAKDKIAFWINTYNVCTIKLIIDRYPIEPKWYMILYPNNSIMQIPGAWTKEYFHIQKLEYTLEEIEDDLLLKPTQDPRICFALSDATIGGAILRNEPFRGSELDRQLDEQVRRYLNSEHGLRLDKTEGVLYLSNMFQMHKDTFLQSKFASILKFRSRKPEERAWLNFILPYLSEKDARYLEKNDVTIKFIQYDWLLNEKR
ncbi:MAG: DUF547 domain-containing protein [Planctomycetaceae bacterium]|nr:DUF547 domain-containing protein [Planctomycetaceae bacterium]